jgi:hypothetical protein
LQYNTQHSNTGYKDLTGKSIPCLSRFVGWMGSYECHGMGRHGLCVFSIGDLPELVNKPHFILNKLSLQFDPISYQCMEEWYNERIRQNNFLNMGYYCDYIKTNSITHECS